MRLRDRGAAVVTGLLVLLFLVSAGFVVHRDPRFPGSPVGGALGIAAATLMLVPFAYSVVKRISPLARWVTARVSLATLLAIHVYAGLLGAILAVLHGGHLARSPMGWALLGMTLFVVGSGYAGRHVLGRMARGAAEQRQLLSGLQTVFHDVAGDIARDPATLAELQALSRGMAGLALPLVLRVAAPDQLPPVLRAVRLADSMAELERGIRDHERLQRVFRAWLPCHLLISLVLLALIVIHVWTAWYFGIRWLP